MAKARIEKVEREVTRVEEVEEVTLTLSMEEAWWLRAVVGMDLAPGQPNHPRRAIRKALRDAGMWVAPAKVRDQVRAEVRAWVGLYPEEEA